MSLLRFSIQRPSRETLIGPRPSTSLGGNTYADEIQFNDVDTIKPFPIISIIDTDERTRGIPLFSTGDIEAVFGLGGESKDGSVENALSITPDDRPSSYDMGLFIGTKSAGTEAGSELMLGVSAFRFNKHVGKRREEIQQSIGL